MSKKYDLLGDRIRKLRVIKNYSQEEIGKVLNLPKQSISRIEKGNRKLTEEELKKIADFFNVTPKYILEEGWIESLYKKPYEPQNKWGIEIPQFIDEYILQLDDFTDDYINSGQINFYRGTIEELKNIIKAFQLFLKECKEKPKKLL